MHSDDVLARLSAVRARIDVACAAAGRPPESVQLLLATKTLSTERTLEAISALAPQVALLGESRAQELTAKGPALAELGDLAPRIHLIGHLQSNKINAVLPWVDCIESIDSVRLAQRVSDRVLARGPDPLDVLCQVNVSGEDSKSGFTPEDALAAAREIAAMEGVRLRGFMTIGANSTESQVVRAAYAWLREVRDDVVGSGAPGTARATELSMGMSRSLEDAIAEGATIVRVGTGAFGERPTQG